jgi:hypothetical protein
VQKIEEFKEIRRGQSKSPIPTSATKRSFVPIESEARIENYEEATTKIANMEVVKQVYD